MRTVCVSKAANPAKEWRRLRNALNSCVRYNVCMKSDVALGYTCVCGERVRVFDVKPGQDNQLPPRITVACPQGHVATFNSKQVALLEPLVDGPMAFDVSDGEQEAA